MLAFLERNAREVGFADNLGEHRVTETARSWSALSSIAQTRAIGCIGSGRLVLEGLMSAPELSAEGEGACWTGLFLRVSRRPRNYPSGACRTGLVASTPELSVGGEGACRTRLFLRVSRRPRNYPSGAKERVGRGWLRLWGVEGAPSVYRPPKGDATLAPELTAGADGDAVDWYAPRSVTYSRRGGIKVPPAATRSP